MRGSGLKLGTGILAVAVALFCVGCGVSNEGTGESTAGQERTEGGRENSAEREETGEDGKDIVLTLLEVRPALIKTGAGETEDRTTANTSAYAIEPDLSNVQNLWQFSLDEEMKEKLAEKGFVVSGNAGDEFFEIYGMNQYQRIPSFVTVDSMIHTYHLYFSYLQKQIERNILSDQLIQLSRRMLDRSREQYELLKGSEWEAAAARNVAFFTVGASLQDEGTAVHEDAVQVVQRELDNIRQADTIRESALTGCMEDYRQYIPRGYYEGDEWLEGYFRAMMWYGRMHFEQKTEDLNRSALLMTLALSDDGEASELWEGIYAVTSFFAGYSGEPGVCEYRESMQAVYGEGITAEGLMGNTDAFERFCRQTAKGAESLSSSVPIQDEEKESIPGFRFMGQGFTIDAAIMQQLVYSNGKEDSVGNRRMLPDVLDVPAALGSDVALGILEESGETDYAGYSEKMEELRRGLAMENAAMWSDSLYACWLNTLRPLLWTKGEGYPVFMQSEAWQKKNLECFAGSVTEMKHDAVLYAGQVVSGMGGEQDVREADDRGYVEPEPLVYARLADLARMTSQGLQEYDMLALEEQEKLAVLAEFAGRLQTISEKELRDEILSAEEYDFIREYGGRIEYFWRETVKAGREQEWIAAGEYPAALVVDMAVSPDGTVLKAAIGAPSEIYAVVQVDGIVKLARGSVYSFYQFPWSMDDRLTDTEWRVMMGGQADEEHAHHDDKAHYNENAITVPAWTESYR